MPQSVRNMIEAREREWLSPYAQLACESAGREREEPPDPVRTCFMRDRDRILHSKSFRRLKHKTQVFIDPQGDHYRTRLTHTLEVAQIGRTIGRALRLNEDLIEAIALGHDVGHTPFGHAGESALDEAIRGIGGIGEDCEGCEDGEDCEKGGDGESGENSEKGESSESGSGQPSQPSQPSQSSQRSQRSQPSQPSQPSPSSPVPTGFRHFEQSLRVLDVLENLNLTQETRLGVGGHSKGRKDLTDADGEPTSTLEAAVVRIADRIAYMNHDLDDAVRSGIIAEVPSQFQAIGSTQGKRIGAMVEDVVASSLDKPAVSLSPSMLASTNDLKEWLFENVYEQYPVRYPDIGKARHMVQSLFAHFCIPGNLPEGFSGLQGAIDYVAGMTDRFAIDTFVALTIPSEFRVL